MSAHRDRLGLGSDEHMHGMSDSWGAFGNCIPRLRTRAGRAAPPGPLLARGPPRCEYGSGSGDPLCSVCSSFPSGLAQPNKMAVAASMSVTPAAITVAIACSSHPMASS